MATMTVYLCGGINGLADASCRGWREYAKAMLRCCATLDPMRRDYRGREDAHVAEIVLGDLADIDASSIVLVNATRPSWGTAMEVLYAHQRGKHVIAWTGPGVVISPWLRYHATEIHATIEDALASVNTLTASGRGL